MIVALLVVLGCVGPSSQRKSAANAQLGTAYLREGDLGAAVETLERAVKDDPRNWNAWQKLGIAYYTRGANDLGDKAFKKALRLEPGNAEINNNYGSMLVQTGRVAESLPYFERALEDLTYRKTALVLNNLGHALYLLQRYDDALQRLDDAITRAPNMCQARLHRGFVLDAQQRTEAALDDYEAVIAMCGADLPAAYMHAAPALLKLGQKDAACAYLRTAIQEGSKDAALVRAADELHDREC